MDSQSAGSLLDLAERASAGATGPDAKASLALLEERVDVFRTALAWFVAEDAMDDALRLANALYRFWITKQRFAEGLAWFGAVLGHPGGDEHLRGRALVNAGMMPFWMGDDARATELFDEGLATGRRIGDAPLTSQAH